MLRKLFKYDLKATGRLMLPVLAAMVATVLINGLLFMVSPVFEKDSLFFASVVLIAMVLMILISVAAVALSYVLAIWRFGKNLLGKEGYIMNTLPVGTGEKILSKLFSAALWEFITIAVVCGAYFLYMLMIAAIDGAEWRFIAAVGEVFANIPKEGWLIAAELGVLLIISLLYSNLMFYAAMTVGHSSSSHKVIKSVGMYIGFYVISQIAGAVLMGAVGITAYSGSEVSVHTILIVSMIYETAFAAGYYALTYFFLKKKLNLQ